MMTFWSQVDGEILGLATDSAEAATDSVGIVNAKIGLENVF